MAADGPRAGPPHRLEDGRPFLADLEARKRRAEEPDAAASPGLRRRVAAGAPSRAAAKVDVA